MQSLRNALSRAIVLGAATLLWANAASAVTFDATYGVTVNGSTWSGIGLAETHVVTEPIFDLTTASPTKTYAPLFQIYALENCCDNGQYNIDGDTLANIISVNFNFVAPTGGAGLPITGVAQGHIVSGADYISISWDNDTIFSFDGGFNLQIQLVDAVLSCTKDNNRCAPKEVWVKDDPSCHDSGGGTYGLLGGGSKVVCSKHKETVYAKADIGATFTLLPDLAPAAVTLVTPVPVPAGLPLLASGVGLFALVARRKLRKAAA